ncbi:MAG: hypothetical protein J4452_02030 [Candidatus Aenigmarchaeota archaeon]|nr:hypothetical protein [Candidatus Aenigmarchaeota archaeon]
MPIKIGVSSGIFGIAKEKGHEEAMQYAGIPRKAMYSITKGVNFVQVDLESISEFLDPSLDDGVKNVEKLGITFGLHSETPAFGQREFPHLDSAIDVDYRRGHERMWIILENANRIRAKYVLVHSSESTPFIFLSREMQPTDLVDVWGRPFNTFIDEENKKDEWVKKWLIDINQGYIWIDLFTDTLQGIIDIEVKRTILSSSQTKKLITQSGETVEQKKTLTDEDKKEIREDVTKYVIEVYYDYFRRQIKSKSLHYGPERTAYYITAKWMERENDPLWDNIINVTAKYYALKDDFGTFKGDIEKWMEWKGIKKVNGKWSIENPGFRQFYQLWVPSVSAKYVWGHFMQDKCPGVGPYLDKDPKQVLAKKQVLFLFETPMAGHGSEDLLRFPQPGQMFFLIKEITSPYVGIAIDLEHLLMDGIDPDLAFQVLPDGAGKYIRVIHSGWPSPLGPAHIPIPIGSEQHQYLYKMYRELAKKGMDVKKEGKDDVYLIFERGGGEDPIKQSVLSLRLIKKFLEMDVPFDKLPLEFYGIEPGQVASEARQWTIIEEHGRDPLKGLLVVPEETHGQLSKSAIEKGKRPEEVKKEEIRG